jgi:hypothetical protein
MNTKQNRSPIRLGLLTWMEENRLSCCVKRVSLPLLILMCFSACIFLPMPERKPGEEETLFQEIIDLSHDRVYEEAIKSCREFLERFPASKMYDVALLKLGEAFEGLLQTGYYQLVEEGMPAEAAHKQFMDKYGHYQCWIDTPCGLQYNLSHYREMMERFPDSLYADEGEYHLITWSCDYKGLPEGPLDEIGGMEKVLQKYPTTSLKPELYYKIAYRFHVLYEISSFSPRPELRNPDRAGDYKEKALYFYRMALRQPVQSKFSRKAWEDLGRLEDGKRIYITE